MEWRLRLDGKGGRFKRNGGEQGVGGTFISYSPIMVETPNGYAHTLGYET